jgi:hypothetical protein
VRDSIAPADAENAEHQMQVDGTAGMKLEPA